MAMGLLWQVPLLWVGFAGTSVECTPPTNGPVKHEVTQWLDQSKAWLSRLDEHQHSNCAAGLAEYLVAIDQDASAFALCDPLKEAAERRDLLLLLAGAFASYGKVPQARYIASLLDRNLTPTSDGESVSDYDRALATILTQQAIRGDIEGAKQTWQELNNPKYDAKWTQLARTLADRGDYDEAVALVAMVREPKLAEQCQRILKEIEAGRKVKTRRKAEEHRRSGMEGYLDQQRALAAVFWEAEREPEVASFEEQKARLASVQDPVRQAAEWRAIAWHSWRQGERDHWQEALRHGIESVRQIPEPLAAAQAAECLLLADLCLATGEKATAIDLATRATRACTDVSFGKAISRFTSGPLLISVLVRTDQLPTAFAIAQHHPSDSAMWLSLGAMGAFCDHLDDLARHLQALESNEAGAALCVGAAYGLHKTETEPK